VLFINVAALVLLVAVTAAFAADGDFTMTLRVVKGYENKTYSFSSSVTKTVSVDAYYSYQRPDTYDSVWKDNELHVTVEKEVKRLFGLWTRWESQEEFTCTYHDYDETFTLNKSISLSKGTYGFTIWRNRNEAFWDRDGQVITRIAVKGNVSFK